jgi:hypothetical protein
MADTLQKGGNKKERDAVGDVFKPVSHEEPI